MNRPDNDLDCLLFWLTTERSKNRDMQSYYKKDSQKYLWFKEFELEADRAINLVLHYKRALAVAQHLFSKGKAEVKEDE